MQQERRERGVGAVGIDVRMWSVILMRDRIQRCGCMPCRGGNPRERTEGSSVLIQRCCYRYGLVHAVIFLMLAGFIFTGGGCRSVSETNAVEAEGTNPVSIEKEVEADSYNVNNGNHIAQVGPGFVVRVSVTVAGTTEIEGLTKRVSASGQIRLPLVGNVYVSGLTLDELSRRLTDLYSEYLIDPQVDIEFAKDENSDQVSPWGYVTVLGRVKNPGRVNIPPTRDLTVSGAIQLAGGFDTSARDSAVRLTRQDSNGKVVKFSVNLKKVGEQGDIEEDLHLLPGDVVYVPEMIF